MGFRENFDSNIKEYGQGGGWFKISEGNNKIRILCEPRIIVEKFNVGICYTDCGYCKKGEEGLSTKYLTWIIDRKDEQVKLAKLPYKVTQNIRAFMDNEEYGFNDFPAPYDVTIHAVNAGTKEVKYTLTASRKNTPVTPEELLEFEKQTPVDQVIDAMKVKQKKKMENTPDVPTEKIERPTEDFDPDEIPF